MWFRTVGARANRSDKIGHSRWLFSSAADADSSRVQKVFCRRPDKLSTCKALSAMGPSEVESLQPRPLIGAYRWGLFRKLWVDVTGKAVDRPALNGIYGVRVNSRKALRSLRVPSCANKNSSKTHKQTKHTEKPSGSQFRTRFGLTRLSDMKLSPMMRRVPVPTSASPGLTHHCPCGPYRPRRAYDFGREIRGPPWIE